MFFCLPILLLTRLFSFLCQDSRSSKVSLLSRHWRRWSRTTTILTLMSNFRTYPRYNYCLLSLSLSISLSLIVFIYLSIYRSIYLPIPPSLCPSIYLFPPLFLFLSLSLPPSVSFFLSFSPLPAVPLFLLLLTSYFAYACFSPSLLFLNIVLLFTSLLPSQHKLYVLSVSHNDFLFLVTYLPSIPNGCTRSSERFGSTTMISRI